MKKNKNMQSNITNKSNNKITDCNAKNVTNKSNNKITNKSENIGFENSTKSFQLDENDEHSFELK